MTSNPGDASEDTGGLGDLEGRGLFDGFDSIEVDTGRVRIAGAVGGAGSAVLLLHGFPETHAAWHKVAPLLAEHHTVVAPDLPGYGRSLLTDDGAWDKRDVAAELVLLMRRLGHERFHVVGHDRGARVGYRLALDYPGQVSSFSSLAVVPILDVRPAVDWAFAKAAFHWFLLLQSSELVEKLLGADPDTFLDAMLIGMAGSLDTLHPAALADYRAAFRRPEVRAAMIDPAVSAQAPRGFSQGIEGALEIDRDDPIEQRVFALGDRRQAENAGIVDEHVDAAEGHLGRVEHAVDRLGIGDVGLGCNGPAAGRLDPGDDGIGRGGVAGVVHHDREAVLGEALRNGSADAAGWSGARGHLRSCSAATISMLVPPTAMAG